MISDQGSVINRVPLERVRPWVTRHIAGMIGRFEGFKKFVEKEE